MALSNDKVSDNIELEGSSSSKEFKESGFEGFEKSSTKESKARKLIGYLIIE
ncbi:hypothetical protein GLOIN_2v1880280 [Rhizophagus irregularis DAOM 181602=DAOM 197198]|uniref:Uncharacterized protein n=2 Tax=Rhizophagus irregularis TaxID=588596 RepID=U9STA3_RHIID|nr:hypothetical protein GLOIN_2v1880280 [Rhizophagus irregularis DAOM 181602=DAOM 197198]PKY45150.1 hypothetical protein RhiirA4_542373 [Rhizophagus irregularis]POG65888.1 hypothetical protein GLOIN_2v1880280 [Rhizophagus irregularis DAOM 181602=DAOM 197198]|eukprot:XP_025172754.1 hypothetical protein GLOIN_2v1880280 [Rhizophagus irregularis DAOM 181602=DAOM 197198]